MGARDYVEQQLGPDEVLWGIVNNAGLLTILHFTLGALRSQFIPEYIFIFLNQKTSWKQKNVRLYGKFAYWKHPKIQ